jgi:hypothetical protein
MAVRFSLYEKDGISVGAVVQDQRGMFLGYWDINEANLLSQFDGKSFAFFEIEGEGHDYRIARRLSPAEWTESTAGSVAA